MILGCFPPHITPYELTRQTPQPPNPNKGWRYALLQPDSYGQGSLFSRTWAGRRWAKSTLDSQSVSCYTYGLRRVMFTPDSYPPSGRLRSSPVPSFVIPAFGQLDSNSIYNVNPGLINPLFMSMGIFFPGIQTTSGGEHPHMNQPGFTTPGLR